ncbi:hypothetical protein [Azospirillum sp.]|uniref:hypothetical protein n=1 Tax=Azospirillum sp. TaxID=34012 RepID=UPI002D5EB07C|nr:hypothetical protein [Azospirillum sp.]HYD65701.1 hypothetical protein [Azospirillum sp.]
MTTDVQAVQEWGQHFRHLYYEVMSRLGEGHGDRHGDRHGALVQFIGASPGCGVSSVARMFALAAASLGDGAVFLFDLAGPENAQHAWFRDLAARTPGRDLVPIDGALLPARGLWVDDAGGRAHLHGHWVDGLRLAVSECRDLDPPPGLDLRGQAAFWDQLRAGFDMVVVDAPASSGVFDGILLAGHMDGVVLVVEAEETRAPVAAHLRDELEEAGATILGVVLNKRRFHIPKFLYRWL